MSNSHFNVSLKGRSVTVGFRLKVVVSDHSQKSIKIMFKGFFFFKGTHLEEQRNETTIYSTLKSGV